MAKAKKYRVSSKTALAGADSRGNRKIWAPGQAITPEELGADKFQQQVKEGTIVRVGASEDDEDDDVPILGSEHEAKKGLSTVANQPKDDAPVETVDESPDEDETDEPVGEKVRAEGLWNMDPKLIAMLPLTKLNALVQDKDSTVGPFAKRADAIAQLSADFVPED